MYLLTRSDGLIEPHGGKLVDRMVTDAAQKAALVAACGGKTVQLSDRGACDVELLIVG
jgi:sulfate adenylyltransferase